MYPAFDHGQAIDHVLDGAVTASSEFLGAAFAAFDLGDVALDGVDRLDAACAAAG